jgi:hypothetical protein
MDEDFDNARLAKIVDNVCLQLKVKDSKWERFLLEPAKKKCKKYLKLQDMVFEALKTASIAPTTASG